MRFRPPCLPFSTFKRQTYLIRENTYVDLTCKKYESHTYLTCYSFTHRYRSATRLRRPCLSCSPQRASSRWLGTQHVTYFLWLDSLMCDTTQCCLSCSPQRALPKWLDTQHDLWLIRSWHYSLLCVIWLPACRVGLRGLLQDDWHTTQDDWGLICSWHDSLVCDMTHWCLSCSPQRASPRWLGTQHD